MKKDPKITVLVDNDSCDPHLSSEHGLSFWIEYGKKHILFDAGQSDIVSENAKKLGIDFATADAIILSHGHYDHTGGLKGVLEVAKNTTIYLHPDVFKERYSRKEGTVRQIGMADDVKDMLRDRDLVWTVGPTKVMAGVTVTGQVGRVNDFEDVGGAFFLDEECEKEDMLFDDMSLFIESPKGIIVVLGCAHSGVVNVLDYVHKQTRGKAIYAVIGGMHLVNSDQNRIDQTVEAFRKYQIKKIVPLHCTSHKAVDVFAREFPDEFVACATGSKITL